jgi:hypothetical protein
VTCLIIIPFLNMPIDCLQELMLRPTSKDKVAIEGGLTEMDFETFSHHLGFESCNDLVAASECVEFKNGSTWYIVNTPTWYKWVLWNTKFDMHFNHQSRNHAMRKVELFLKEGA